MTQFSIVVPTLNESENIDLLLARLFALSISSNSFEVIFVDDSSNDGTPEKIRAWQKNTNIHLIERTGKPDLTASILAGTDAARSDIIVVMDADLSHPHEQLNALVTPLLQDQYDVVIGSRYIDGGGTEGWPFHRKMLSRIGGWLARPFCDVSDATSGFFAFRRELAATISARAHGYKILLEILMANDNNLRIKEIPICFRDRTYGTSKLSFSHQMAYLQRLMVLAGGKVSTSTAGRFALVGLFGMLVDVLVFQWMINREAGLALAHFVSFFVAVVVNYLLNATWSFQQDRTNYLHLHHFSRFFTVALLALLLRGGVLALCVEIWNIPPPLAIFPAILAAALINYLGSAFYVFQDERRLPSLNMRWRVAAVGIILYCILLRLIYLGLAQLIPDEAYYWQYAQHIDLSYFDHPPMVAWLIWLGTALFGDNEFGVRAGAFVCSLIAMGFLYAYAQNLYNKSTALRTVLLFSVLPLGFASGFLMTTDAPLAATWMATIYFMERALVAGQRAAWIGVGIAFGLGLLSKYTLILLGLSALVFMWIDPVARDWLKQLCPYLAALLALLIFSPVLIWNFQHEWISFMFQSTRHVAASHVFSVHYLLIYIMVLLTPVGLFAAFQALVSGNNYRSERLQNVTCERKHLFIQVVVGVPLFVFLVFSTFDHPKFHWTGPIWLAVLPTIAWMIGQDHPKKLAKWLKDAWQGTITICLLLYALILHYVVLGIPGIPYQLFAEHYFWREAIHEVESITQEVRQQTGMEPIIVGMSKWSIASSLYFYNHARNNLDIRSRNFFGDSGAMYDYWFPSQSSTNRPIIQIGMKPKKLVQTREGGSDLKQMLINPGEIKYRIISRNEKPLRRVYYRIAHGFKGVPG